MMTAPTRSHRTPWIRALLGAVPLLALFAEDGFAAPSSSRQTYLALEPMADKKVRVDGLLREWPNGFAKLDATVRGSASRDSASRDSASRGSGTSALVGYDDKNVYFALNTDDSQIARTASAGKNEDHLTFELWFPSASGGGRTHVVDVYPGDPGKLPAVVKVDGKAVSSAQAVEAPQDKGYYLEGSLPWSALAAAGSVRVGLRGRLEYTDASSPGQVRRVIATSRARGAAMPPVTLESETGLIQALLEPKELGLEPARQALGNVFGGPELERIAVYGHFLSITGPGYKDGKQFYFSELDVAGADAVRRLELVDFDGDGKQELVLQKRIGGKDRYRDVLEVQKVGSDGAPLRVFVHEVALKTDEGLVQNEVKVTGSGKNARIEIKQGKANGFDPGTYREPQIDGVDSVLLPWQSVGARVFSWGGRGLALLEEKPWKAKQFSSSKAPPTNSQSSATKTPPPPRPPSADEMLDRVYALYKKDRGVGGTKPKYDFVTDVAEDSRPERVLVHGKDVVVFGKGFKEGLTYTFITVGVKEPKDILDVTSRDLTGDGRAEIILRGVLSAQASKELGGDVVQREALYVYSIVGDHLVRIFAAETGRALGGKRIVGAIGFTSAARGVAIELRPGRAVGWNEQSYPFPEDTSPAGGLEPLLLPWGSQKARTYAFTGSTFERR